MKKSSFDGRLHTQAEYDSAKHGTYANKSTDTSGLGEYSDEQLLKEVRARGILKPYMEGLHGLSAGMKFTGFDKASELVEKTIKEIIGE